MIKKDHACLPILLHVHICFHPLGNVITFFALPKKDSINSRKSMGLGRAVGLSNCFSSYAKSNMTDATISPMSPVLQFPLKTGR